MVWADAMVPVSILVSGGFCAFSLYTEVELLESLRLGASRINTSGRQRMLSQRL
jgi:hypothetical protein